MATQRLSPDAILLQTNLSGVVSAIQDDPDSPNASWLTAIDDSDDINLRVSFPTPTESPVAGAGLQEFKTWLRASGPGVNPDARLEVWESGVSRFVGPDVSVGSTSGELVSLFWNASVLTVPSGAGVELRIFGDAGGVIVTDPFDTIEVGAVEWNVVTAQLATSALNTGGGSSTNQGSAAYDPAVGSLNSGGGSITSVGEKAITGGCDYEAWTNSQNPIAYWRLGESAGPTAFDETGNHDGTYTGTPGFSQPGLISSDPDTSVDFTSGKVTVPYSADFDNLTGFTVRAWVNLETAPPIVQVIAKFSYGALFDGWALFQTFTDPMAPRLWVFQVRPQIAPGDALAQSAITTEELGMGVHLVGIYDPPTLSLYVQGVLRGGAIPLGPHVLAPPGTPLTIDSGFDGLKDEVAFFDYAWTPEQVLEDYQAGTCGQTVNSGGGSNTCQGVSVRSSDALNTGGGSQTNQGSAQFVSSAFNSGGGDTVSTGTSTRTQSLSINSGGGGQTNVGSSGSGSSDALIVCDVTCRTRWQVECKSQRWQVECKSC